MNSGFKMSQDVPITIDAADLRLLIHALDVLERRATTPHKMLERVQQLMGKLEAIEDELPPDAA